MPTPNAYAPPPNFTILNSSTSPTGENYVYAKDHTTGYYGWYHLTPVEGTEVASNA